MFHGAMLTSFQRKGHMRYEGPAQHFTNSQPVSSSPFAIWGCFRSMSRTSVLRCLGMVLKVLSGGISLLPWQDTPLFTMVKVDGTIAFMLVKDMTKLKASRSLRSPNWKLWISWHLLAPNCSATFIMALRAMPRVLVLLVVPEPKGGLPRLCLRLGRRSIN